jgi:hypothetical protein
MRQIDMYDDETFRPMTHEEEFEWQCIAQQNEARRKWQEKQKQDAVNSPSHYKQGDIECIDAIKASMSHLEFLGYLKGNCQKYIWRYKHKGNEKQDLAKARWYLERLEKEIGQ